MNLCNEEMLDTGLGVRLTVAAATPAPTVPASPGKQHVPLSSSSFLRRRCSSWWLSNGNAHGRRDTTTTSSRAMRRRWWWSDHDGSQEDYDYDYDYEGEAVFSGFGWAEELLDESWFSKVYKTYGVLVPVMLTSMFAATGLKAFLMAMAIPLSQSAISSFLLTRRKGNRDDWWMLFFKKNSRWRRSFQEEEYSSSSCYEGRRRRYNYRYRSWVSKDSADAASTSAGADDNIKNRSSGGYGGWDELLDNNSTAAAQLEAKKRSSNSYSQLATLNRGFQRLGRKMRIILPRGGRVEQGVGAPPRRRRMPRTTGLGSIRYKQAPLLMMRLMVAVFPFLGSWFRLL